MWRHALRDNRTYSDVVINKVQGVTAQPLHDWHKETMICYQDTPLDMRTVRELFDLQEFNAIQGSQFDDYSMIVSKCVEGKNLPFMDAEVTNHKIHFKHVIP